jgi:hypothetical protein
MDILRRASFWRAARAVIKRRFGRFEPYNRFTAHLQTTASPQNPNNSAIRSEM